MNSADVFAQIETMGCLPSLPRTLLSIQHVASDDRSSAEDLAACILEDQALTMRVLKMVNSAMYRRQDVEKVRTVHRAVVVIGFETVRKLALGLSVFDMMSKLSRSPLLADIAKHSLVTAALAEILAEATGRVLPEEAFVCGLVHDIGKVVLTECSPSGMDAVLRDAGRGMPRLAAERRHFGITHDRAGRRLAAKWQLPPDLQNLIGDHHDIDPASPPRDLDPVLGVTVFANAIAHFGDPGAAPEQNRRIFHLAMRSLGIPGARQEELYAAMEKEVADLATRIGMEPENLGAYHEVVNVDGSASVGPRNLTDAELARHTADQLALYRQIGHGVAVGEDPEDLLRRILAGAVEILGFERVVLLHVDRPLKMLSPWAWVGPGTADLADRLRLPLCRETGALALAAFEHRTLHAPNAASPAYGNLVGPALLAAARCTGFVVAPVLIPGGAIAVLYADCGPDGPDVTAEQAAELTGFAGQIGLVCGLTRTLL